MSAEERAVPVCVVVDVANVMGSRPDGWWKDRAAAATRLLAGLPALVGRTAEGPYGDRLRITRVVAVVEGVANVAAAPDGVTVVRAPNDGDSAIAAAAEQLLEVVDDVLVVTADRGLRARLAHEVRIAGPNWLNDLLGR